MIYIKHFMKHLKSYKNIIPFFAYSNIGNEKIIHVSVNNLFISVFCLKSHINYQYNLLSCISGVDNLTSKYRFNVVYELLSIVFSSRIRIKIYLNEITSPTSLTKIFINANWWEREIWDLFGIYFSRHPDLRRLLTDYGFEGHPLRKDFPISGFLEVKYDLNKKQVIQEPLELAQSFRFFNFEMPW